MFSLPELPYAKDALSPHMSAETLEYHHGKHHKAYVDKLNDLVKDSDLAELNLEPLILKVSDQADASSKKIFNNAAQHWNHSFFWKCLSPDGGGTPKGALADLIDRDFGGYDRFAKDFQSAAVDQFGSGWAWLIHANDRLDIVTTHDADLPLVHGQTALLTCDVWEHAYYIDHRNARPKFVEGFLANLANWDYAAEQLDTAKAPAAVG